jgi:hypothetical protein
LTKCRPPAERDIGQIDREEFERIKAQIADELSSWRRAQNCPPVTTYVRDAVARLQPQTLRTARTPESNSAEFVKSMLTKGLLSLIEREDNENDQWDLASQVERLLIAPIGRLEIICLPPRSSGRKEPD